MYLNRHKLASVSFGKLTGFQGIHFVLLLDFTFFFLDTNCHFQVFQNLELKYNQKTFHK